MSARTTLTAAARSRRASRVVCAQACGQLRERRTASGHISSSPGPRRSPARRSAQRMPRAVRTVGPGVLGHLAQQRAWQRGLSPSASGRGHSSIVDFTKRVSGPPPHRRLPLPRRRFLVPRDGERAPPPRGPRLAGSTRQASWFSSFKTNRIGRGGHLASKVSPSAGPWAHGPTGGGAPATASRRISAEPQSRMQRGRRGSCRRQAGLANDRCPGEWPGRRNAQGTASVFAGGGSKTTCWGSREHFCASNHPRPTARRGPTRATIIIGPGPQERRRIPRRGGPRIAAIVAENSGGLGDPGSATNNANIWEEVGPGQWHDFRGNPLLDYGDSQSGRTRC